ncbi:CoA-transferase [Nocardia salmonicida]|uniref:CoA-transferase n=1 Tax=Nocardia salmonicida TaxID=53431 RepID=UPI0037BB4AB1
MIDESGSVTRRTPVCDGRVRCSPPMMATAVRTTVVEVVETGALDPEHIITPAIFVDRVVHLIDQGVAR